MIESTISSPALMFGSPQDDATRLIASVALRVKTISSVRAALRNFADLRAAALIGLGRGVGEVMQAAMHVGVFALVGFRHAVEHRVRLLRRGGVVEIDQRLAVDLQRQRGKSSRTRVDVIGTVRDCRMHGHPRAASQRCAAAIASSRRSSLTIDFDGLADEGLDQQRLRFLLGKPARAQVEQQALVERAGGGAMAAGDVVGEDLELRLVVGLGLVGQQQRPRHHLGVGLLRVGRTMMRPWNTEWPRSSTTARNTSRLAQFGTAWSMNSVVSACWRPLSRLTPLVSTREPSPANVMIA